MVTGEAKLIVPQENSGLISPEYQKQQESLHETLDNYGTASIMYAPLVSQIIERTGVTHLLDYGCGAKVSLSKALKVKQKLTYQAYDPGVPRFSKPALPAELVCCIDVLEHIEPDKLDAVLDDLVRVTEGVLFCTVCTCAAYKTLPDGRNAHLIQEPPEWWLPKLMSRFEMQTFQVSGEHIFYFIGFAKPRLEAKDGGKLVA